MVNLYSSRALPVWAMSALIFSKLALCKKGETFTATIVVRIPNIIFWLAVFKKSNDFFIG